MSRMPDTLCSLSVQIVGVICEHDVDQIVNITEANTEDSRVQYGNHTNIQI